MLKLKVDFKSSAISGDSVAAAFRRGRSGVRQLAAAFPATATLPPLPVSLPGVEQKG